MGEFAIGQPVSRTEDPRLLRGGGRYVDDLTLPNTAYGAVLRAAHAHAKVNWIDTSAARKAPGVIAVLTDEDWQALKWKDLPSAEMALKRRDGSPIYKPPYPAMARGMVRYAGDPVAFVIAESAAQAADAVELIEVDYEPLPALTDTSKALEPGQIQVWPDAPDNICYVWQGGDKAAADAAFAKAEHVVKYRAVVNRVTAAAMEPRAALSFYDTAADRLTVHTTLQRAFVYRAQVAEMINVPESKVRVVATDVGGSFGMKSALFNEVALTILGTYVTRRPVKWTSTRSEAFLGDAQARDHIYDMELALTKAGKFLGLRAKSTVNVGAYVQTGGETSAIGNIGTLAGVYVFPAIHVDVTTIFSHTNPMRPYRGNGRGEAAYAIERIVDLAADELGIDPVEIRRMNMIAPDAMPYKTGLVFTYDCGDFANAMDETLRMADYAGFAKRREEARKRGKLAGIGVSFTIERSATAGFEGAEIRFDRAGTVTLLTGAINQGQGHATAFTQVLCDRLGVAPEDVHYISGDTDAVSYGEGTGGSRSAAIGGSAVLQAADKVLDKARKIAAHLLEVEEGEVDFDDGVFKSRKTNQTLTIKDVAQAASKPNKLPAGMEPGLLGSAVYNNPKENFPNGCHICELEIDEDLGTVEITRYTVVDDVGTVINPLLLKGQIKGGIAQGVGQLLLEDIKFEPETGQLLTGSFMDYAMPRAHHLTNFEIKSHPTETKTNPLGVKGAGEAGCVGAMPAVGNALVDALSVYGIKDIPMPATPQRIWEALAKAKQAAL
ncbi:MAG: xanthine dehydrogenase family protein molybdopterin-binding subunit [Hyphomicrobiaceae bacterium]